MQYIKSILDQDLYKFTMQNAVLHLYPDAQATYTFINRNPNQKFNEEAYNAIEKDIAELRNRVYALEEEISLLRRKELRDLNEQKKI
jgi:nicotinate phosphoribosyltransferase